MNFSASKLSWTVHKPAVLGTYVESSIDSCIRVTSLEGQHATEHRELATVQYYTTKLPVYTTGTTCMRPLAGNSLIVGVTYLSSTVANI